MYLLLTIIVKFEKFTRLIYGKTLKTEQYSNNSITAILKSNWNGGLYT